MLTLVHHSRVLARRRTSASSRPQRRAGNGTTTRQLHDNRRIQPGRKAKRFARASPGDGRGKGQPRNLHGTIVEHNQSTRRNIWLGQAPAAGCKRTTTGKQQDNRGTTAEHSNDTQSNLCIEQTLATRQTGQPRDNRETAARQPPNTGRARCATIGPSSLHLQAEHGNTTG